MYRKLTVLFAFSAISLFLAVFSLRPQGAQASSQSRQAPHGQSKIASPLVDGFGVVSAASRKNHAGTDFDIVMPLTAGLNDSTSGIESRASDNTAQDYERQTASGSPICCNYLIVLAFSGTVTGVESVTVTAHNPAAATGFAGTPTFSGSEMSVPLGGVSNAQALTLSVVNATDGVETTSFDVNIGFLIGDTTGNRKVNSSDVSQTKALSGTTLTSTTARVDVTVDGNINSSDVSEVKAFSGTAAP